LYFCIKIYAMKYFEPTDSLFEITEKYPETLKVFTDNGFTQLADEAKRATFGQQLQLEIALSMRQLDYEAFSLLLETAIAGGQKQDANPREDVRVKGLLPCPVRLPLQERLDKLLAGFADKGISVAASLKAASMGLDWIIDEVAAAKSADELDDIYLSAGFDVFFEEKYFGRFIKQGDFGNPIRWNSINTDFQNDYIQLKDPKNRYGIIAVVPAVFLVNTVELGDRPLPLSWKDLTNPTYERSVSLPVSDFDLFNAILLTMDEVYGQESVAALGRNMQQSLHPAQMVKSDRSKTEKPAITIMPNFFTKMAKAGGVMQAVWPEDGAIISPVFMISRRNNNPHIRSLADFLSGPAVAEILAHQGLFPSLHPNIDNRIPPENKYMWLGWDYIEKHNLNQRFIELNNIFNGAYQTA
jgi:ABC-type Fe3+ transport system substrate-binding protein